MIEMFVEEKMELRLTTFIMCDDQTDGEVLTETTCEIENTR